MSTSFKDVINFSEQGSTEWTVGGILKITGTETVTGAINLGGTVTFTTGGTITNNGTLTNSTKGSVTQNGAITFSTKCTITNNAALTNSTKGSVNQNGNITFAATCTETHSGSMTVAGTETLTGAFVQSGSASRIKYLVTAKTTGSTSKVLPAGGLCLLSSTKTAATFTLSTNVGVGTELTIYCTQASATGKIRVKVGTSGTRTFDGTNYIYDFLKSNTYVKIILGTTARWYELIRSVADGTSIASTST